MSNRIRIIPNEQAAIFLIRDPQGEPVRDEEFVRKHFPDYPESQLVMLLHRCNDNVEYLNKIDLRYMGGRITKLLDKFLEMAPPSQPPPEIEIPEQLKSLIPGEPEILSIEDFTRQFKAWI